MYLSKNLLILPPEQYTGEKVQITFAQVHKTLPFHARVCEIGSEGCTRRPAMAKYNCRVIYW